MAKLTHLMPDYRLVQVHRKVDAAAAKTEVSDDENGVLLVGIDANNSHTAVTFLQVFGLDEDAVTVGTTPPTYTFALAPGANHIELARPLECKTGLTYAVTATRTGDGAPGAVTSLELRYA